MLRLSRSRRLGGRVEAVTVPREFSVRCLTKESVEYREGGDAFEFVLGRFVDIPRAEDWDRVVPEAFHGGLRAW
jgi:hypothetical protein